MKNKAMQSCSNLFKALGNLKRLEILFFLLGKELNVGELEKLVGISQSALSQHLAVLRTVEIVKTRREAQTIYYSLHNNKVISILRLMDSMFNQHPKLAD